MELKDKVAVVTGAATGIGRGLAVAFANEGARAVVVADINGDRAVESADFINDNGGTALAVTTDVADQDSVNALVNITEETFGPVDLFCANAGVLVLGGVHASDDEWRRAFDINVMSHVYAARAVLPGMVARGEGYLLHTASAAGLLTQLGAAPYSMSKHAAVSIAEWISITYGDAGVKVSCLCPQAVRTEIAAFLGIEPGGGGDVSHAGNDGVLEPEDVARVVIDGLRDERFLILPHAEVEEYERRRAGDRERWLRGMRKQQKFIGVPDK
ncbi:MAG: SDR family oxidoreductase [Acidimicrobiales bacterium]|nr:SDR family oxidoreductase [Acidimicrobiales bacterium]